MSGVLKGTRVYWASRWLTRLWLRLAFRFRSEGSEQVPAAGGCIIAANHVSFLDPPVVSCGVGHRHVQFMARDTLYKPGFANWFMKKIDSLPIDRTRGDVAALRRALSSLKDGNALGLFPEGTRSPDGQLQEAKGGIGFLIAKAGVPVIPAYISGTYEAFPRNAKKVKRTGIPIRIRYGTPITPEELTKYGDGRDSYDQIAKLVMGRIAALRE